MIFVFNMRPQVLGWHELCFVCAPIDDGERVVAFVHEANMAVLSTRQLRTVFIVWNCLFKVDV